MCPFNFRFIKEKSSEISEKTSSSRTTTSKYVTLRFTGWTEATSRKMSLSLCTLKFEAAAHHWQRPRRSMAVEPYFDPRSPSEVSCWCGMRSGRNVVLPARNCIMSTKIPGNANNAFVGSKYGYRIKPKQPRNNHAHPLAASCNKECSLLIRF